MHIAIETKIWISILQSATSLLIKNEVRVPDLDYTAD